MAKILNESAVAALLLRWRQAVKAQGSEVHGDLIELLHAGIVGNDKNEPVHEIARTICEILEQDRLGAICWASCKHCGNRLTLNHEEERGICARCYGT